MLHKKLNKTQKKCCAAIKKIMLHKKRHSCRLEISGVAQERNTLHKMVCCVTKKKSYVTQKRTFMSI